MTYCVLSTSLSSLSLGPRFQASPTPSHISLAKLRYVTTCNTYNTNNTIQTRLQIINHSQEWSSLLFILSFSRIIYLSFISKGVKTLIIMMMMIQMQPCVLICSFPFPSHFNCLNGDRETFSNYIKIFHLGRRVLGLECNGFSSRVLSPKNSPFITF